LCRKLKTKEFDMEKYLDKYAPYIYVLLRFMAGAMFALHGSQKLLGFPADPGGGGGPLPPLMMVAGVIELVAGLMIALGLLAGFAAFLASGEMAFAYFMSHAPRDFWPILNRGEATVLYCFLFLYIAARGSGVLSLDALLFGKRRNATQAEQ
jgi:putative oxidoreductase